MLLHDSDSTPAPIQKSPDAKPPADPDHAPQEGKNGFMPKNTERIRGVEPKDKKGWT